MLLIKELLVVGLGFFRIDGALPVTNTVLHLNWLLCWLGHQLEPGLAIYRLQEMAMGAYLCLSWSLGDVPTGLVQKQSTSADLPLTLCILLTNADRCIGTPANKFFVAAQFIEAFAVSLTTPALWGKEMRLFFLL